METPTLGYGWFPLTRTRTLPLQRQFIKALVVLTLFSLSLIAAFLNHTASGGGDGLSKAEIAGIAIGATGFLLAVLIVTVLIIVSVAYYYKTKKNSGYRELSTHYAAMD